MTQTFPDYSMLLDSLVEKILDSMDTRTLEEFARQKLTDTYGDCTYEELLIEADDYGLEVQELIPD